MSKNLVSFKNNGLEVIWLNNTKEYSDIIFLNNSRPKNLIEKEFNTILLKYLLILWKNIPLNEWTRYKLGRIDKFNELLKNCKYLRKDSFKEQILLILNDLSLSKNFIINYRKSYKINPIIKLNKFITPIIRLWYIRIFEDKNFSAIRIQTVIRIFICKKKFINLKKNTNKWLNLYFLNKKSQILKKTYLKQHKKLRQLEKNLKLLKQSINDSKLKKYKFAYKNKQIQRLKYENIITKLNDNGYIKYKKNNNLFVINYYNNEILIGSNNYIIIKKQLQNIIYKYNTVNDIIKYHKFII
jgi:hypothetical protein